MILAMSVFDRARPGSAGGVYTPYSVSKVLRCNDMREKRGTKVVLTETLIRRVVSAKDLEALASRMVPLISSFPAFMFSIVRFSGVITCKTARVNFLSELCGLERVPRKKGLTADRGLKNELQSPTACCATRRTGFGRPSGTWTHVVWLSQDSAAVHPGLFSFVPYGNFVVFSSVESHEQVQKHSSGPTGRGQKCGRFPGFHPGLFSAGPSGANSSISRTQDLVMDGAHGFVRFDAAKKQVLRLPFSLFRVAQDDGLLGEGAKSEEKQVLRLAALRCVRSG
jgi:hypothetical protein